MVEGKAAEVRDKAAEKAEMAENAMEDEAEELEKSKVGKALPTHIEKVGFKQILYLTIILMAITTIPIYLGLSGKISIKKSNGDSIIILRIFQFLLILTGLIAIVFDTLVIMLKMQKLFIVSVGMKVVKIVTILILLFVMRLGTFVNNSLQFLYYLGACLFDLLFLYYGSLYFKRLKSSEYDESGNKKDPGV